MTGVECASCHSGSLTRLDHARKLPDPATLFPPELKDELEISLLSQDYAPTTVKHREIATRLTRVSNENRLASFFHTGETTICSGCHHVGAVETGKRVPPCSACHTVRNEPTGGIPTLLGAYHQQCLGCHRQMGYPEPEMPQSCTGCHREKPKEP
jgi:hypothetical protein